MEVAQNLIGVDCNSGKFSNKMYKEALSYVNLCYSHILDCE